MIAYKILQKIDGVWQSFFYSDYRPRNRERRVYKLDAWQYEAAKQEFHGGYFAFKTLADAIDMWNTGYAIPTRYYEGVKHIGVWECEVAAPFATSADYDNRKVCASGIRLIRLLGEFHATEDDEMGPNIDPKELSND